MKLSFATQVTEASLMNISQRITIIVFGIMGISITSCEVGQFCRTKNDCSFREICSNGSCSCETLIYTTDSVPLCRTMNYEELCRSDETCMANAKCIDIICQCNEGYHRFTDSCSQVKVQGLMKSCSNTVGQKREICDISKNSLCQSKICVCALGFIPSPLGQCEPKSSYIARFKLTEYRVKPGWYCREDEECIDGLNCKNFTCSCPSGCTYESRKEVCDCGEVDEGTAHIYVGIFLGVLITLFWYKITKCTINTHKNLRTFQAVPVDLSEPPSYSLSPVRAETTANASPSSAGLQCDSLPVKQPPEFNLQPQLSSPINPSVENPPTSSELDPPPPYNSLLPTATDPSSISAPASNVSPTYETQPAYNPYYQEANKIGK